MAYMVVFIATRWGSELGGVNVFNRGLAEGMTGVLPKGSKTICFVNQIPVGASFSEGDITIREHENFTTSALVNDISNCCDAFEEGTLEGVLVVGHDAITGQEAIDCAKELQEHVGKHINFKSAVIAHMDYSSYAFMKNLSLTEVTERSTKQRKIISAADWSFAVGPLLQSNFASARSATTRPRSPVRMLVPGVDKVKSEPHNSRVDLQFFISGRLNREDDPIKNSVLAVHALAAAYKQGRQSNATEWQARGQLFAWGVDPVFDKSMIDELKTIGSEDSAFVLHAEPFSDDQAALRRRLASCHVALMPSWHEGFGLSGWEALCAGVPLICSRQSGLAFLIDKLTEEFPAVSFRSIEFVNVSGSPGPETPNPEDIAKFADVLHEMISDIEARKQAAILLADLLKREFSWKRCASDLLKGTDWYFPGSVHWSRRQVAGRHEKDTQTLERIIDNLDKLDLEENWADLTTVFNSLSDAGKNANLLERAELLYKLRAIGRAIGECMADTSPLGKSVRDSGHMDVCWRFMAACANICSTFREFSESFPEMMLQVISKDLFLTKELFYYSASFADEFTGQASEIAPEFFEAVQLSDEHGFLATRLARLSSKHSEIVHLSTQLESNHEFLKESVRCRQVKKSAHDIAQAITEDPKLASTALALMALDLEPARQVADQVVDFFKTYYPKAGSVKGHWRGDKRVFAAFATASLSTHAILEVLRQMANDEDESIRWAALHLAFSHTLRRRLEAAITAGSLITDVPLNQILGNIVDKAIATDSGHPWLHREFLSHYLEEHASPIKDGMPTPLVILDFPLARWLIGPVVGQDAPIFLGAAHPEVTITQSDTRQMVKRILLVLPPINDAATGASRTSTPALGLGLLASHLIAQGHDVQIADCHRFPELRTEVLRFARTFDLIGFNTVFSTIRSTMQMLVDIRKRTQSTTLVIGGPAAKLNCWQFSTVHVEDAPVSWDFAITTDAVENLSKLVMSLKTPGPWTQARGIIPNLQSWNVIGRDLAPATNDNIQLLQSTIPAWVNVVLDRRVYRNGTDQYEPAKTRSNSINFYEAHVVMSQGCDWNCAFCTERKDKSGGEQRRQVTHVLSEIRSLASQHRDLRIQFVDDNLLPQISAGVMKDAAKYSSYEWSEYFLNGLTEISEFSGDSFGWRGIFRVEDFFAYEAKYPNGEFIVRLHKSGCRMLAFGIEHGSEEQRRKSKAANILVPNKDITALFNRLKANDILTKAYFMIGGQWESRDTAQQTIDFAIQCGVTLAYFALYKDFSKATAILSKEQQVGNLKAEAFIHYDQLFLNWDKAFTSEESSREDCTMASGPVSSSERECYHQLSALGFKFTDLVKYNDFHNEELNGGSLLRAVTWDSPSEYFKTVEQAYRQFYLRPSYVQDYSSLLAHGY